MCFDMPTDQNCPTILENKYHEVVILSDYRKNGKIIESKLIPGLKIHSKDIFYCPRCKYEKPMLEHGIVTKCNKCKLGLVAFGNLLYIWDERK